MTWGIFVGDGADAIFTAPTLRAVLEFLALLQADAAASGDQRPLALHVRSVRSRG